MKLKALLALAMFTALAFTAKASVDEFVNYTDRTFKRTYLEEVVIVNQCGQDIATQLFWANDDIVGPYGSAPAHEDQDVWHGSYLDGDTWHYNTREVTRYSLMSITQID